MQWKKRCKLQYVIGSGRHSLLLKSYSLKYLGDVPRDGDKGTNHEDPQNATATETNSALDDVSSSIEESINESFPDESSAEPNEQAPLEGCYINGLWMPLDYEKNVACHPFYAPFTVLPSPFYSGTVYSAPLPAPMVDHLPCADNCSVKHRHSSPYWSSSYLPTADGSEDNVFLVPYLYPGYTFGPSVYTPPTGSFITQDGRRKRKRRYNKPSYRETRIQPGVDVISTPSCDIIRYQSSSAGGKKASSVDPTRDMTEEQCLTNGTEDGSVNISPDSVEQNAKITTENEQTETSSCIQTENKDVSGTDTNGVVASPTTPGEENQTSGVRTVSRFKVYPCTDDPLRDKIAQESNRQPSPCRPSYFTSSETLLRETELELNRLNKKALQANQSIYQLAFDESLDDDSAPGSSSELADFVETKTAAKQDDLPEELRDPPGSRMEIEVHEMDSCSEAGSEDVEILPHRYDTQAPTERHVYVNKLSLATELLRTRESLPYDSEFKRLVDEEELPCVEFDRRINSLDSGVQSEDSGDEVVEEPKSLNTQKEEIWCTTSGQHYRRPAPTRIPYLSSATSNAPFPCLCCIIM